MGCSHRLRRSIRNIMTLESAIVSKFNLDFKILKASIVTYTWRHPQERLFQGKACSVDRALPISLHFKASSMQTKSKQTCQATEVARINPSSTRVPTLSQIMRSNLMWTKEAQTMGANSLVEIWLVLKRASELWCWRCLTTTTTLARKINNTLRSFLKCTISSRGPRDFKVTVKIIMTSRPRKWLSMKKTLIKWATCTPTLLTTKCTSQSGLTRLKTNQMRSCVSTAKTLNFICKQGILSLSSWWVRFGWTTRFSKWSHRRPSAT